MTTVVRIARLRRPGGGTEPARARFSRASAVSSRPAPKRSARWDLARASVVLNSTSLQSLGPLANRHHDLRAALGFQRWTSAVWFSSLLGIRRGSWRVMVDIYLT